MALVNGAPCAAAALADAALGARGRLAVLEEAFALALEAVRAPHAHLDPALDGGWRDPHEAASLGSLRALLEDGATERRSHQVAVAFRDAPRLLGWFRRVLQQAEECAAISLSAPGDNPTFAPEDARVARAPALERGVPRPARGAHAERAGRVVRGPGEPRCGTGDPAGRGSGRARGRRGRAVRDPALDDRARLGRGGARRGSADAHLARRQRPERHVVAGAAGLASRGGCRDLPARRAGMCRDPRVAHHLTRRGAGRPRGCRIGSIR